MFASQTESWGCPGVGGRSVRGPTCHAGVPPADLLQELQDRLRGRVGLGQHRGGGLRSGSADCVIFVTSVARSASVRFDREARDVGDRGLPGSRPCTRLVLHAHRWWNEPLEIGLDGRVDLRPGRHSPKSVAYVAVGGGVRVRRGPRPAVTLRFRARSGRCRPGPGRTDRWSSTVPAPPPTRRCSGRGRHGLAAVGADLEVTVVGTSHRVSVRRCRTSSGPRWRCRSASVELVTSDLIAERELASCVPSLPACTTSVRMRCSTSCTVPSAPSAIWATFTPSCVFDTAWVSPLIWLVRPWLIAQPSRVVRGLVDPKTGRELAERVIHLHLVLADRLLYALSAATLVLIRRLMVFASQTESRGCPGGRADPSVGRPWCGGATACGLLQELQDRLREPSWPGPAPRWRPRSGSASASSSSPGWPGRRRSGSTATP